MVPSFDDGNFSYIIIPVTMRGLQWTIFDVKGLTSKTISGL